MKPKKGTNFDVSDSSLDRFGNALEIDSCLIPAGGESITTRIQVDFMLIDGGSCPIASNRYISADSPRHS